MNTKKNIKTYSELVLLPTFKERFNYLKLGGKVGEETFGFRRQKNQEFYHSQEWLRFRDKIIIRDGGCDLAVTGLDIYGPVLIHHINPITFDDIVQCNSCIFDPENVICVSLKTHNAIHYGNEEPPIVSITERTKNDTILW